MMHAPIDCPLGRHLHPLNRGMVPLCVECLGQDPERDRHAADLVEAEARGRNADREQHSAELAEALTLIRDAERDRCLAIVQRWSPAFTTDRHAIGEIERLIREGQ
jgi:hypothetical protein